jgi:HEPN domain-containing protein
MNRLDFQQISIERLADAEALLTAGRWQGAYYMSGYAVECALKACIAQKTQAGDFPPKDAHKVWVHNLKELLERASLSEMGMPQPVKINWAVVIFWSEGQRYESNVDERMARDMLGAIRDANGVLTWLQTQW